MIQILSPGRPRPKPQETRQLRCPECGCVFAYDDEDVQGRKTIPCPQEGCDEEVRIDTNKIIYRTFPRDAFRPLPGWIAKKLRDRRDYR